MAMYIILSRFSPEAFREPKDFRKLAEEVSSKIKSECPSVRWKDSFASLGRFDVIDLVEADDPKQIREGGHAHSCLRPFDYRDAGGHSLEGVSCQSLN